MGKKIFFVVIILIIIIGVIAAVNVLTNNDEVEEVGGTEEAVQTEESFSVEYAGVDVTPGVPFDETAITEEYTYSEIQSCAFDGYDKVYTYSGVEIDSAEIDGVETVYYVYFIDTETETTEGVKLADSVDVMLEAYGEDYEQPTENSYVYTRGDVILTFVVESDVITSIEYTLNVDF